MKKISSITKVLVAFVLLMVNGLVALSIEDHSALESSTGTLLSGSSDLAISRLAPEVHIGSDEVTITCESTAGSDEEVRSDLGSITAAYWAIVDEYPEAGDLRINMKSDIGMITGTATCEKAWVRGLNMTDKNAVENVITKVVETFKTTEWTN